MENIINKKSFNKKLEVYYQILKKDHPELINNINIINDEILYFIQLFYENKDKFYKTLEYSKTYDMQMTVLEVKRILKSINPIYERKFIEYLKNKKIAYIKLFKSCTNGKKIYIRRRNNIEDVMTLIHEFFHFIHLEKYDYDMNNKDWYIFSEMIAITFELYALLKLYENADYKNDLTKYFLLIVYNISLKVDSIISEAMMLNMYDKYGKVDTETFYKYIKEKQMPIEFISPINDKIRKNKRFEYHYTASYIFGFPLSFYMANKMINDDKYFSKVLDVLENMNKYNYNEIMDKLELSDVLSPDNEYENLYQLMLQINDFIDIIYNKSNVKKIGAKK